MVLVFRNIQMDQGIVVNGTMIKFKVEVKCIDLMGMFMKASGKIIKLLEKEFLLKQMEDNIMAIG